MIIKVSLGDGESFALVDEIGYEMIWPYRWHLNDSRQRGKHSGTVYARTRIDGKPVMMHRFIMKPPSDMVIDHINHNGLDNRLENLRICNHSQNGMNRMEYATDFRIVFVIRNGTPVYRTRFQFDGKKYDLGPFENLDETTRAYDIALRRLSYKPRKIIWSEARIDAIISTVMGLDW